MPFQGSSAFLFFFKKSNLHNHGERRKDFRLKIMYSFIAYTPFVSGMKRWQKKHSVSTAIASLFSTGKNFYFFM